MKIRKLLSVTAIIAAVFMMTSCANKGEAQFDMKVDASEPQTEYDSWFNPSGEPSGDGSAIVYNVSYEIEGEDLIGMISNVGYKMQELGGYVSSSRQSTYSNTSLSYITYRIPSENLNAFMTYVDSFNLTTYKTVNSQDVSYSYNQYQAKIETLEARIEAYENYLKTEGLKLEQIIAYEDKIADLQTELITYHNMFDSLDNKVKYSTIEAQYRSTKIQPDFEEPGLWEAFGGYLVELGEGILTLLLYCSPFLVVAGVTVTIVFVTKKKKKAKLQ